MLLTVRLQDVENGAQIRQLDELLLIAGRTKELHVPSLEVGETFEHALQVCALASARLRVDARLSGPPLARLLAPPSGTCIMCVRV
jgi:hypothetical protein